MLSTKIWSSTTVFNIDNNKNIFFEHQISILEWFLKDYVTLTTGVIMQKFWIAQFLNCSNISQYYCLYCTFDQKKNAALVSIRYFFSHNLSRFKFKPCNLDLEVFYRHLFLRLGFWELSVRQHHYEAFRNPCSQLYEYGLLFRAD